MMALEGFYRKCGIDIVREQLEANFTKQHPYDVEADGLLVWPRGRFDVEVTASLKVEGMVNPLPAEQAAQAGLHPVNREEILFSSSHTDWQEWERIWLENDFSLQRRPLIDIQANASLKVV
jgi:hypothetical protein